MPEHTPAILTEEAASRYRTEGVLVLRGLFADWVEVLRAGLELNMRKPGPYAAENTTGDETGRFFDDYCNWQRIAQYRDFVLHSPAGAVAGAAMGSRQAQLFHEHVLVKEPGTSKPTPWHQDMPYYCVDGEQTASFWIPLDPVTEENTLRLVPGSHLWPRLVRPRRWAKGESFYADESAFMDLPDLERGAYPILAPALEPGDAVLFTFKTVHGAPGNTLPSRRRAFSARYIGDDARFIHRPGRTSPPFPGIGQNDGERLREDWFPVVWREMYGGRHVNRQAGDDFHT